MKVLVTGVKGQLGYDVVNELTKRGIEAVGVDIQEMDITDAASVEKVIGEAAPDAVVHCAAYTAVDAAEDNVEICRKVNADGTQNIANVLPRFSMVLMKFLPFTPNTQEILTIKYFSSVFCTASSPSYLVCPYTFRGWRSSSGSQALVPSPSNT